MICLELKNIFIELLNKRLTLISILFCLQWFEIITDTEIKQSKESNKKTKKSHI